MNNIFFRRADGTPIAGAVVAITSAPTDMIDLGYVTGDDGAIALTLPAPGSYGFTLTAPDGEMLTAREVLPQDGTTQLIAHA